MIFLLDPNYHLKLVIDWVISVTLSCEVILVQHMSSRTINHTRVGSSLKRDILFLLVAFIVSSPRNYYDNYYHELAPYKWLYPADQWDTTNIKRKEIRSIVRRKFSVFPWCVFCFLLCTLSVCNPRLVMNSIYMGLYNSKIILFGNYFDLP